MDLIYANNQIEDIGVLLDYEFDLAFGRDENDFELKVPSERHCCKAGYFVYFEGTEYGGIIDGVSIETDKKEVAYFGRTWHGLLASKIITPLQGSLAISGTVADCLTRVCNRVGLGELFAVSDSSGASISDYKLEAYADAYKAIRDMLKSAGLRLHIEFREQKVRLSAVPIVDYSQDEQFDSDLLAFEIKKVTHNVNHLVCVGVEKDDGSRLEVHLYANADGEVSQTQTFFGLEEKTVLYERESTKNMDDLIKYGTEKLQSEWQKDEIEIELDDESDKYGIGDIVGAYENVTETEVAAPVVKKIVTVKNGQITISYEIGEENE